MSKNGRPPTATPEERQQVWALAAAGYSQREIAERAFGDRRLRGRVERILRQREERQPGPRAGEGLPEPEPVGKRELSRAELRSAIRRQMALYLARAEAGELKPSPSDLRRLLEVDLQLALAEQFERAQAATRESG